MAVLFARSLSFAQEPSEWIAPEEAWRYEGKTETVCGQVVDTSYVSHQHNPPTYLFVERPSPDQVFTVEIPSEKRDLFGENPEKTLKGKNICVTGKIEIDNLHGTVNRSHRATILIEDEEQISIL